EPLPNCRSICASAVSRALSRSPDATGFPCWVAVFFFMVRMTLRGRYDNRDARRPDAGNPDYPNSCSKSGANPDHLGFYVREGRPGSADGGGKVERVTHGPPHLLGPDPVGQRLVD